MLLFNIQYTMVLVVVLLVVTSVALSSLNWRTSAAVVQFGQKTLTCTEQYVHIYLPTYNKLH